jgi:L-ascorbate metabolism protein UlaG (beta-lactamase superfamily)
MNKALLALAGLAIVGSVIYFLNSSASINRPETDKSMQTSGLPSIIPIEHATAVLQWEDAVIYTDPAGGAEAFTGQQPPTVILVTDIHGDHLSTSTLAAVMRDTTTLIVPQAVKDLLPADLATRAKVLANGDTTTEQGINILAMPMYNLPESPDSRHTKGRGNGYVLERGGIRVYIAGDTAGIPEMRALTDIDLAFVPMNLPYTMGVEEAADAVLDFKPARVYPYHYRGPDGLADVNKFKELVNASDSNIDVVLLDWYPKQS